jgi:hypothetical protein
MPPIQSHPPHPTSLSLLLLLIPVISALLILGEFVGLSKFQPVFVEVIYNHKPTAELANDFYLYHFQQMNAVVNESSIIGFWPWLEAFEQDLLQRKERLYKVKNDSDTDVFLKSRYIEWDRVCGACQLFQQYKATHPTKRLPHVLISHFNENWGAFSEYVPNRTCAWTPNLTAFWENQGCSKQQIMDYLNHPDTQLVVTTQFQSINHPKVVSVPLGIKRDNRQFTRIMGVLNKKPPSALTKNITDNHEDSRPTLLMINSAPGENRLRIFDVVFHNFAKHGIELENLYPPGIATAYDPYLEQLRHAKFILSPSGMGFDCYRHWEAILMGTIPVLEHLNRSGTDGWLSTFDDLPVAWIDSYDNLTPQWLENEYHHIVSKWKSYQYKKLTLKHWIDLVQSAMQ